MSKIVFKNPKGNTFYYASVGFDWGAFWSLFLVGLPFFVRNMKSLGIFCIGFNLIVSLSFLIEKVGFETSNIISWGLFTLGIALYFGFSGGRLTARHYLEEGYKIHTTDKNLISRAKAKWQLEE